MFEHDTFTALHGAAPHTLYVPRIMEHVRRLSKQVFGAQYRLEVAAALTQGQVVTLTSLATALGPPPSLSSVANELATLEQAGLLRRLPPVAGMRSVYLEPVATSLWDTCRQLAAMALEIGVTSTDSATTG